MTGLGFAKADFKWQALSVSPHPDIKPQRTSCMNCRTTWRWAPRRVQRRCFPIRCCRASRRLTLVLSKSLSSSLHFFSFLYVCYSMSCFTIHYSTICQEYFMNIIQLGFFLLHLTYQLTFNLWRCITVLLQTCVIEVNTCMLCIHLAIGNS